MNILTDQEILTNYNKIQNEIKNLTENLEKLKRQVNDNQKQFYQSDDKLQQIDQQIKIQTLKNKETQNNQI